MQMPSRPESKIKVIGVVGKIGAGKDVFANYLAANLGAIKLDVSDFVREEAKQCGVGLSREELTQFSVVRLKAFGPDYFVRKVAKELEYSQQAFAVLSGIRTPQNERFFRNNFRNRFILVSICVPEDKTRYERIRARSRDKDPVDENELAQNDRLQEKQFGVSETIKLAELTVENNGSLRDLEEQAKRLSRKIIELLDS